MKKILLPLMLSMTIASYATDNNTGSETPSQPVNTTNEPQVEHISSTDYKQNKSSHQNNYNMDTRIAFGWVQDNDVKNVDSSEKIKDGYDLSLEFVNNGFNQYIETGWGVGFSQHSSFNVQNNGKKYNDVTFKSIPLYLTAQMYLVPEDFSFRPFVKVIGGYSFNLGSETIGVTDEHGNYNQYDVTIKDGLYYGFGVGVEVSDIDVSLIQTFSEFGIHSKNMKFSKTTLVVGIRL